MFSNHQSSPLISDKHVCTEFVTVSVPNQDGNFDVTIEERESKCNLPKHGDYDLSELLETNVDLKPVNPPVLSPNLSPLQVNELVNRIAADVESSAEPVENPDVEPLNY